MAKPSAEKERAREGKRIFSLRNGREKNKTRLEIERKTQTLENSNGLIQNLLTPTPIVARNCSSLALGHNMHLRQFMSLKLSRHLIHHL